MAVLQIESAIRGSSSEDFIHIGHFNQLDFVDYVTRNAGTSCDGAVPPVVSHITNFALHRVLGFASSLEAVY